MDTVLVTGGSGYLGGLTVRRFARRAIPTISVARRPPKRARLGVNYISGDLRTMDLASLLTRHHVTRVVHLAAVIEPPRSMTPAEVEDIEVGGTHRVIEACLAAGVNHLTVTSSGAAYGYSASNDRRMLTEEDPTPGSDAFAYSRHKAQVERLLGRARRAHPELSQLVLRPGTILGERTDNQITALLTARVLPDVGGEHSPFTFVWDDDVAEIIVRGSLGRRSGIYNVAGDGVLTIPEIARLSGRRAVRIPAPVLRVTLTAAARVGLGRYGPEQVDFLAHRPVLDNSKLHRDFPGLPTKTTRETFEIFRTAHARPRQ